MQVFSPSVLTALTQFSAVNAGVVNIPLASTDLQTLDCGLVVAGQILFVSSQLVATKGGTVGETMHQLRKSAGTATIVFCGVNSALSDKNVNHLAGFQWLNTLTGIALVTASGTLTLATTGFSTGSDSTVAIGGVAMQALRINR